MGKKVIQSGPYFCAAPLITFPSARAQNSRTSCDFFHPYSLFVCMYFFHFNLSDDV